MNFVASVERILDLLGGGGACYLAPVLFLLFIGHRCNGVDGAWGERGLVEACFSSFSCLDYAV